MSGNYLVSRAVSSEVPSASERLTAVFGMGTGGSVQASSPHCWLVQEQSPQGACDWVTSRMGKCPKSQVQRTLAIGWHWPLWMSLAHSKLHRRNCKQIVFVGLYLWVTVDIDCVNVEYSKSQSTFALQTSTKRLNRQRLSLTLRRFRFAA